ncbi:MAG: RagB/SusD family nutrient uptake outer membrane protein [Gemmatimonadota bacterium]
MKQFTRRRARRSTIAHLAIAIVSVALAVVGCKDITSLKQQDPSQLSGGTVFVPANAQLIVNGVVADFECAYTRYVVGTGIFTDELANAIARIEDFQLDRRDLPTNAFYGTNDCVSVQLPGIYTPLSVARGSADTAAAALENWTDEQVPNRALLLATSYAYGGYSITLLAESMCSAAINLGPELTPAQLFQEAITRFDKAVAAATAAGDNTMLQFAQLGRARAKLDAGDLAGAAADAQQISDGFIVQTSNDVTNTRRQNTVWSSTLSNFYSSVDTSFQNLYAATGDPRVASTSTNQVGTDGFTTVVYANKDATSDAPIAIAKWSEAQLIIAENDVANGQLPAAVAIINVLQDRAGQPHYSGPLTAAAVKAQIIEERRREFFLEGHRLGDLRRYNLPFLPATGAPYGPGGTYGSQTCFPLPDIERINNPNIGGTG